MARGVVSDQAVTNREVAPAWGPADEPQLLDQTLPLPNARPGPSIGSTVRQLQPRRLGMFSSVGAIVFVLGTAFQWLLILIGDGKTASYIWQALFSIELSFALNRRLTWRDRNVDLVSALVRWNAQKWALTVPNVAAYALLVWLGMNWLVANVLLTVVFTIVNYAGAHLWSFRATHLARHRASATGRRSVSSRTAVRYRPRPDSSQYSGSAMAPSADGGAAPRYRHAARGRP